MKKRFLTILSVCLAAALIGCSGSTEDNDNTIQTNFKPISEEISSTENMPDEPNTEEIMLPENTNCDMNITISPLNVSTTNGGKFQGWGTSLCWWANRLGYSDTLAQQSADLFFGNEGLRFNIMRYNIGGGDDPSHDHITRTDSAVPGWLVYDETKKEFVYDTKADFNQLNVLERASKAAGENAYVEVFSNSPPYFMTESGCSSGNDNANSDNLKLEYYIDFAEYLASVARYINDDMGIKVSSVSPMNEPNTNYWGANSWKQEGCHFDPGKSQSDIIVKTAKAFLAQGLSDVEIVASDETSPDKQITAYNSYSDEALSVIDRISTHTYSTGGIAELGALVKSEGLNLWMSEVDGGGTAGENAGEMGSALWLGEKIISDINALSPSAWVMWQIIDNHISAEGVDGKTDTGMVDTNGGFWGAAVADHDNEKIVLTQKYYGLGQFTRYIRPGSTIIHCGGDALAAYNEKTGELVITVLNKKAEDKICNFDLSQMKSIGKTVRAVRTSGNIEGGESWAELSDINAYDKGFIAELKGNSITTFIMRGVSLGTVSMKEISLENASVTGSEPWQNGGDVPENVIDGSVDTFFDGVTDGWLEIDFGEEIGFNTIGYAPRTGFESRMTDGKFYGSNDGEQWTVLYEITSAPALGMNYAFLPQKVNYRYLRYDVPFDSPGADGKKYNCNIAEAAVYVTELE